jgi:integrase
MAGYGRALEAWERVEIERAKSEAHFHSEAYQRARDRINTSAPEPSASTAPLLTAAFEAYFRTGDVLGSENKDARQRATRRFVEHVGPTVRTTDVTKAMAVRWLDELQMARTEIVGTDKQGKPVAKTIPGASKLTARGYCGHMKMIWEWLIPRGEAQINPWDGIIKVKKSEKKQRRKEGHWREPFDVEQLRAIFNPATFQKAGTIHARWGAVLGLYLGARVGEIAQMFVRDFGVEDGVPFVKITDESDGQRVKSDDSVRLLPLHPDLIRLGLLEYVEERRRAKVTQLFDVKLDGAGGVGNAVSKAFGYYVKTIVGLTPKKRNGEIGMHSFRKSLTQLLKSKETIASPGKRLQFMGRENKQGVKNVNEIEDDFYANEYTVAELVDVNNAIDWSDRLGLDCEALRTLLIYQPVKAKKPPSQRSAYAEQRAKERAAEAKAKGSGGKKK